MKRNRHFLASLLLASSLLFTGCISQIPVAEEKNEIRVAATSVAVCEILDALGVEEVVGVPSTESSLPERYQEVTAIGLPMSPDLEMLKGVQPTIVFSPISLKGELASQYEQIKTDSYFVDLSSVEGMYASIEEIGTLLGKEENASKLVEEYETWRKKIEEKQQKGESPTVLILMGLPGSYVVATEHSYVGNLVKIAGGKNVYEGESEEDFINVNTEDMRKKNPDIILRTAHAMPEQVMKMFQKEFKENDIWKHFDAVKEERVYDLNNTYFGMSANFLYKEAVEEVERYLEK